MSHYNSQRMSEKTALNIAVLTVSNSRTEANDTSGDLLTAALTAANHRLATRQIVPDNVYQIRALVSQWIADPNINAIISTGGTGITGHDSTPEAMQPLFDKTIDGFGELFRWVSYHDIGTSCMQSRCIAGVANGTLIFCLPGSNNACQTGWDKLIAPQLDSATKPCNLTQLMPRLQEHLNAKT